MRVTEGKKHNKKNGATTGTDGVKGTGKGDGHCYFSLPWLCIVCDTHITWHMCRGLKATCGTQFSASTI